MNKSRRGRKPRLGRPPRTPGANYKLRDIPKGSWSNFKTVCRKNDVTLRDALIHLITEHMSCPRQHEPQPPQLLKEKAS